MRHEVIETIKSILILNGHIIREGRSRRIYSCPGCNKSLALFNTQGTIFYRFGIVQCGTKHIPEEDVIKMRDQLNLVFEGSSWEITFYGNLRIVHRTGYE